MTRQRLLLIVLLAWALVMIVPDILRVVQPLGSFGLYADNDGVIYDVVGPFDDKADSPAWNAGVRVGDRLALSKLRCYPYDDGSCRHALMTLGGHQLVLRGRQATLDLEATHSSPARQVTLVAAQVPANPFERFIVLLDQIAGILVVIAAAWLVWTRPGRMSWGFFLYVMWFNPGQYYAFYAILSNGLYYCSRKTLPAPLPRPSAIPGSFNSSSARQTTSPTASGDGSNGCFHSSAAFLRC
jgi:hypothetical protein